MHTLNNGSKSYITLFSSNNDATSPNILTIALTTFSFFFFNNFVNIAHIVLSQHSLPKRYNIIGIFFTKAINNSSSSFFRVIGWARDTRPPAFLI